MPFRCAGFDLLRPSDRTGRNETGQRLQSFLLPCITVCVSRKSNREEEPSSSTIEDVDIRTRREHFSYHTLSDGVRKIELLC